MTSLMTTRGCEFRMDGLGNVEHDCRYRGQAPKGNVEILSSETPSQRSGSWVKAVLFAVILASCCQLPIALAGRTTFERSAKNIHNKITAREGMDIVIPFDITWQVDSSSITLRYTIRLVSKNCGFYDNGRDGINPACLNSVDQLDRFSVNPPVETTSSLSVNLNILDVSIEDADRYTMAVHLLDENTHRMVDQISSDVELEVEVVVPPGSAECYLNRKAEGVEDYQEVRCKATAGNMDTLISCFQDGAKMPTEKEVYGEGKYTKGIFRMAGNGPVACCSHFLMDAVTVTTCEQYKWPHHPQSAGLHMVDASTVNDLHVYESGESAGTKPAERLRTEIPLHHEASDSGSHLEFSYAWVMLSLIYVLYFLPS